MHKKEKGIERYKEAQENYYATALEEVKDGCKRSHWMWFVFPQISGLGHSQTSKYYEIIDLQEAKDYWNDPLLSSRLIEITEAIFESGKNTHAIFGYTDNMKLRSCMTLFWEVSRHPIFKKVIHEFYGGGMDGFTLAALNKK